MVLPEVRRVRVALPNSDTICVCMFLCLCTLRYMSACGSQKLTLSVFLIQVSPYVLTEPWLDTLADQEAPRSVCVHLPSNGVIGTSPLYLAL